MAYLSSIISRIANTLFPPLCGGCDQYYDSSARLLCIVCRAAIEPVLSGDSLFGARRVPIVAVGAYKGPLVRLILGKARKDRIAAYELGVLMAERISATSYRFDCIVPVPIHWSRILWRGYDQVFESAQALSAYHRRPLFQAVCRSRATPFQSQVPVEQRERNVRNAFVLTREADNLMGKSVLLVDDVYTTGATLKEVVRVLLRAQPREIIILVGARVVS